jgi:hypothetical protein
MKTNKLRADGTWSQTVTQVEAFLELKIDRETSEFARSIRRARIVEVLMVIRQ